MDMHLPDRTTPSSLRAISILILSLALTLTDARAQSHSLTHGIVVGGVTESSARFWIRLNGGDLVNIEIATDSSFTSPVLGVADSTRAARNFATIISATGLSADTRYFYRPLVGGTTRHVGGSLGCRR